MMKSLSTDRTCGAVVHGRAGARRRGQVHAIAVFSRRARRALTVGFQIRGRAIGAVSTRCSNQSK